MSDEGTETTTETVETVVDDSATTETGTVKDDPKTFDKEYVEELRSENAKWRTKLREKETLFEKMEAKIQEFENAQLSAEERAAKEVEDLRSKATVYEAKARENSLALQIALAAQSEKINDVKAAVKLADRELIEYDDNGQVTNLTEVIEALRGEYSSLFASAPTAPNTGSLNPGKASKTKPLTRADLKGLSPERIMELEAKGELNHLLGRS